MNFEFIKLATFTRLNLATSKTKLGLGKYWDYCVPRSTINPVLYPYLFESKKIDISKTNRNYKFSRNWSVQVGKCKKLRELDLSTSFLCNTAVILHKTTRNTLK